MVTFAVIAYLNVVTSSNGQQVVNPPIAGTFSHSIECFVCCCNVLIVSHITLQSSGFCETGSGYKPNILVIMQVGEEQKMSGNSPLMIVQGGESFQVSDSILEKVGIILVDVLHDCFSPWWLWLYTALHSVPLRRRHIRLKR